MIFLSLPLGLAAWLLPLWAKTHEAEQKGRFSLLSAICCILSLLNVLWDLYRTALVGDYAALSDITNNLAICSILLLLGTTICNWWLHGSLPVWMPIKVLLSGLPKFLIALGTQILLLLPFTSPIICHLFASSLLKLTYVFLMLAGSIVLFVVYLHKTPKERVSFGIPLAVALFPVIESVLGVDLTTSGTLIADLGPMYYQSCLLLTATAVTFLRVQHWLTKKRKENPHG